MTDFFNPIDDQDGLEQNDQGQNKQQQPPAQEKPKSSLFNDIATSEDLDQFIDEAANTPKQQYNHQEKPSNDPAKPDQPGSGNDSGKIGISDELQVSTKSKAAGQMVAKTIDFGYGTIGELVTDKDRSHWTAKDDEMKELIEAWSIYIESTGQEIPPWVGLLILNVVIYGFKVPTMIKARKEMVNNKKAAEQSAQIKLERERVAFEVEKKNTGAHSDEAGREGSSKSEPPVIPLKPTVVFQNCRKCGKDLTAEQIKRGGEFCSSSHSNQWKAEEKKKQKESLFKNQ